MKENLIFYHSTLLKCKYDELKLMLGFQVRIRLDLDLFDRIRILQQPIFKRKKGFTNLSLGLIYYRYSTASSQPPSRDTVPLTSHLQCLSHFHLDVPEKKLFVCLIDKGGKKALDPGS
jgi:hypothetical protein